MRVGVLGSGLMGGKLGTILARAGTPDEVARDAGVLLLAVHWSRIDDVLQQAGALSGKVIVTCTLPLNADDSGLVIGHTSSGAGPELAYRFERYRASKGAASATR